MTDFSIKYIKLRKIHIFHLLCFKVQTMKAISDRVPGSPGPSILRIFTREGATVFCLLSTVKVNPPPGGCHHPQPRPSILVFRSVILVSGLDAVVAVTEALPVALIPEERVVSSVRDDVVNIGRLDVPTGLQTLHTQRMGLKVALAGSVPCGAVASAACGACVLRVQRLVLATVFGAVRNEHRTAGVSAWCVGSAGHWHCPLSG